MNIDHLKELGKVSLIGTEHTEFEHPRFVLECSNSNGPIIVETSSHF